MASASGAENAALFQLPRTFEFHPFEDDWGSGKWEISSFNKIHVKGRFQLNNTFQGISLFQF